MGDLLVLADQDGALRDIGQEIAGQFGSDFFGHLIKDALGENLGGLALAQVPWIGVPAGAGLAALLAWTLTWRVGLTVSVWFQNGGEFVGGSRAATVKVIKDLYVHGHKPTSMKGTVNRVRRDIPDVVRRQQAYLSGRVDAARHAGQAGEQIRETLSSEGYPRDLVDDAVGR